MEKIKPLIYRKAQCKIFTEIINYNEKKNSYTRNLNIEILAKQVKGNGKKIKYSYIEKLSTEI